MSAVLPEDLRSILFRRQQLQNRLRFLQEIQKKNNRIEGSLANDEGPSELERIEEELKVLEEKEKELIQKKSAPDVSASVTISSAVKLLDRELGHDGKAIQGLYILPFSPAEPVSHYIPPPEEKAEEPPATNAAGPEVQEVQPRARSASPEIPVNVTDIDDVTASPATVKCPSCEKVVTTETRYKVGSNALLFCCLLSVVGCLAGCCLVPFCMDRFKDVSHRCPSCHEDICSVPRL